MSEAALDPAATAEPSESTGGDAAAAAPGTGPVVFKKSVRKGQLRKRESVSPEHDVNTDESGVTLAKKPKTSGNGSNGSADAMVGKTLFGFDASRSNASADAARESATRVLDIDTERDRDAQAIYEKSLKLQDSANDGMYHGQAGYAKYLQGRAPQDAGKTGGASRGPLRAPTTNVRISTRIDYAPDVCKNYKLTGNCNYGDNCIYLHDRSDYKAGWQLDRDWDIEQKKKKLAEKEKAAGASTDAKDKDEDDDGLPFACLFCEKHFTDPVVTRCGHYFCSKCAMEMHRTTKKCKMCGEATNGVFNKAKELIAKINRLKQSGTAAADDASAD